MKQRIYAPRRIRMLCETIAAHERGRRTNNQEARAKGYAAGADGERAHTTRALHEADIQRSRAETAERALLEARVALDEVERLRAGIRAHRDEKGHDRCWIDDVKLYGLLPEGVSDADLTLPPKEEFLRGCDRYYELRRTKTHDEADEEARRLAADGKLGR